MIDPDALRERLRGPVHPVLPAFDAAGGLDLDATAAYVDALVRRGAHCLIVTAGTSRLNLLSFDEVAALNAAVARACDGRAVAVAGNPATGSTAASLELLDRAERDGADAFLAVYSDRYYGDEPVFGFFETLAQASRLPLLLHTIPMRLASSGPTEVQPFHLPLVEKLAGLPNVVGMKEENGREVLRQQIVSRYDRRMTIVLAGGGMRNYLANWPFGASSYLVGVGSFLPEFEADFYSALQENRLEEARRAVFEYELPFFDVAVPIGWHTALKASLALMGLMPGYERAPLQPPTDRQQEALRSVLVRLGWLQ
jgi:dihydrodipicolinate synthase/N-acetylneuraminate lyase